MSPIRRVGESLLSRLQGGRDIKVPPMDRAAEQARQRLLRPGVAGPDFRAGQLEWNPTGTSPGFSGELGMAHNLGRVPKGAFIVSQTLQLQWSTPAAQLAKWTDQKIFFWIDLRHPWEMGEVAFDNPATSVTVTLAQPRVTPAKMRAMFTMQDQIATDRPPLKHFSTGTSGGLTTTLIISYADQLAFASDTIVQWAANTELNPSDRFVWQVI